MKITVQGDVELRQKLSGLGDAVAAQRLRHVMQESALIIYYEAVRIFHSVVKGHGKHPGELEGHMEVGMSRNPNVASAWFKNKGRHTHLFEFGHVLWAGGRSGSKGRAVGVVRGKPFFRPAVDATKGQVRANIKDRILGLLNEAARAGATFHG